MSAPFLARWDGEMFQPLPRFAGMCERSFKLGQTYALVEPEPHSDASRGHYFACITEAWRNLPEEWGERFATSESLRKWALIRTGYCDRQDIVCDTKKEAERWAGYVRQIRDYSEVSVAGHTIVILTPQSQSKKTMGRKRFQESKQAVLELVASLIDVNVDDLTKQAKSAA